MGCGLLITWLKMAVFGIVAMLDAVAIEVDMDVDRLRSGSSRRGSVTDTPSPLVSMDCEC